MRLKEIEISGFKSFAKKATLSFDTPVTAVVGPNGSGKSNVVEAFRFVLGEQSMKSMRGKSGADLIFRGGANAPKLSRASVAISFDNSDKVFAFQNGETQSPILFDTVTFTRELFADGTSAYKMNGSEIRLKQMIELLASVHIGTSGHHIISQGEADGILRANPRERREMLEDALGLKIYHYRIRETENKLAKSTETLKDVQSLRRELAPHLKFLQKQVEKIEKAAALRTELEGLLIEYLATERDLLVHAEESNRDAVATLRAQKDAIAHKLAELPTESVTIDPTKVERITLSGELDTLIESRRMIESRIARLQGTLDAKRSMTHATRTTGITLDDRLYQGLIADLESVRSALTTLTTLEGLGAIAQTVTRMLGTLRAKETPSTSEDTDGLKELALELESLERELAGVVAKVQAKQDSLRALEGKRDELMRASQEGTVRRYELLAQEQSVEAELQILAVTHASTRERKERFEEDLKEAGFLFGPTFLHTLKSAKGIPELPLHEHKRAIDRLKIRLDEHAGIGTEVVGEYNSTRERDEYLTKEVTDIEASITNLETLLVELKQVLDTRFASGVETINARFGEFFKTMFGGGTASLSITAEKKRARKSTDEEELLELDTEEEQETVQGIDVHVSLPEKKVKELTMLSGGERSLVSIALLFAISQVNPPPFLVLDETDAALDEANSRRYGDMIERLSEYSQLIVVTHNRETMSRAHVLYGVTLGSDGGSKLLSIKFDEAVKVAK